MAMQVDKPTTDLIRWYLQEKMAERGLHPSEQFQFGWGTVMNAAQEFKQWAEQVDYKFFAVASPLSKDGVPSDPAMSQRIRMWLNGSSVTRKSVDDARWVAKQIKLRTVNLPTPEFPAEIQLEITPPAPSTNSTTTTAREIVAPSDNSLDTIRDLAKSFRDFGCVSEDNELAAILANTELALLRLLSDRL